MGSNEGPLRSAFFKSALEIVDAARDMDIRLRLLGATAIYYQCQGTAALADALNRNLTDLDFVTLSKHISKIPALFSKMRFIPNERVNALYGANRQIYYDRENSRQVDIFFDKLSFNHELDLRRRLDLDPVTISLADLLLEKLQIVKMSEKDAKDIIVLLREHKIGGDAPGEIDVRYVAELLANDWGFHYTATTNLGKVHEYLKGIEFISGEDKLAVSQRIDEIGRKLEAEPKSFGWKMRARVGTRTSWYTEAEDVEHRR